MSQGEADTDRTLQMNQTWFEMQDLRRRRLNNSVWIPLKANEYVIQEGKFGYLGYVEEFYGVGSLAVSLDDRPQATNLDWSSAGLRVENSS